MRTAKLVNTSQLTLPLDSYIYKILLRPRLAGIAAISSDDSLRIIDSSTLQAINGDTLRGVHVGVTCLQSVTDQPDVLLTAGRDAAIRGWDVRNGSRVVELSDCIISAIEAAYGQWWN